MPGKEIKYGDNKKKKKTAFFWGGFFGDQMRKGEGDIQKKKKNCPSRFLARSHKFHYIDIYMTTHTPFPNPRTLPSSLDLCTLRLNRLHRINFITLSILIKLNLGSRVALLIRIRLPFSLRLISNRQLGPPSNFYNCMP